MDLSVTPFTWVADISAAGDVMRAFIGPVMITLGGLATLVATFFLIISGIQYMTSKGSPEKLEQAKRVMRNALIGLVIVLAAGTLTAILTHAYGTTGSTGAENIPALETIQVEDSGSGIVEVLIKAITGLFKYLIETAATPFVKALDFFTNSTVLMAQNPSVFKMWLTVVGIADVLFVIAVALLGFHVMSASSLGLDEIEIKHMIPQLALTFLLINTSIFAIDAIIGLSNVMISAVGAAFSSIDIWDVLLKIASGADGLGLAAMFIMLVFMILSVILIVYYVMRIVTLYVGGVLSPLVILLAVLPGFKDFAITAAKAYLTTIFVLFVHVIILHLAASIFAVTITGDDPQPNTLMAMIIGIATLISLLKTQGVMMQISYISAGPRALRKLGAQFVTGVSYTKNKLRSAQPVRSTK